MDQSSIFPPNGSPSLLTAVLWPPGAGSVLSVQVPGFLTFLGGLGPRWGRVGQVGGFGQLVFPWPWESHVTSLCASVSQV